MADKTLKTEAKLGAMEKSAPPSKDDVKPLPKPAKITKSDWQKVEIHLKNELDERKNSDFRRAAESKWKEIDRQIAMNPMVKVNRNGQEIDQGWHNVVELGELSKASENLSADVRRIVFPQSRFWFEGHADIDDALALDKKTGEKKKDSKLQEQVNGRLRSFMVQQHQDFGLKDRVELSVKEALNHGGFVAEVDWATQEMIYEAVKVKSKSAPIWKPHSMWNCYPDPSPSVVGTNLFYDGSMFIESYVPRSQAERMVKNGGEGWMPIQWKKVSKDTHKGKDGEKIKDVRLTTFWGDINIDRADESLYYPNHKAILMNGTIVYMAPNDTPYSPIIYKGYERIDVRDPYYTSPIMKQSPMQKCATMMCNKAMDGIELWLEPPIVWDANDPQFVMDGGPVIAPGASIGTKGPNAFTTMKIGDPGVAINGLQLCLNEMKEKLGRPGREVGDRATKAEVVKAEQDSEVSMVDFVDKMEIALKSYLFMQHAMNLEKLTEYSFYSPEMQDPDFIHMTKKDLPKAVHFDVVGSRGVLGEEERNQKMSVVTAFAAGNPLFAPLIDAKAILMQMFQDAGIKAPERFLIDDGELNAPKLKAENDQMKQMLQKMGGELQQEKQKSQVKMAKIQSDHQLKTQKMQVDHADKTMKIKTDAMLKAQQLNAEVRKDVAAMKHEIIKDMRDFMAERHDKTRESMENQKIVQVEDKLDKLAENIKQLTQKKTMKAKKVNGEWNVESETA